MLNDCTIAATLNFNGNPTRNITLTTANDYIGTSADGHAVISRASGFNSTMMTINRDGSKVVLTNVTLDGRKEFDNTYASRLEKMKDSIRVMLSDE